MKGKPKNLWKTVKRLFSYMGRYSGRFVLVGILSAVSALANLFGTYMIKPIVNEVTTNITAVYWSIALMALIYIIGVLSSWGYTQLMVKGAQKVVHDIRQDLLAHVDKLPIRIFDTTSHGDLMARFTSDVDTVSDALNNSFAMCIQSLIQSAGTLILLFVLNWQLSLIVFAFYILMFIYILLAGERSRKYFTRQQNFIGALNGFVEEMITGLKVVKVFNHEKANSKTFAKYNEELAASSESALSFSQTMVPVVVSLSYVNYAIVAVAGGYMALNGTTTVGALASYLVFVRQAAMPINQFVQQSNLLLAALSGAERIFDFMDLEPESDEGKVTLAYGKKNADNTWTESDTFTGHWVWKHPRPNGVIEYVEQKGDIQFHDVDFGYVPEKTVLKDVNLYAKPGQTIALVGSTGAGKTTITNLLNRFYDIQNGSITYDGIDIKLIAKDDLRRSLAMVLQDTHLFTGTIMDNIRFGNLSATDEEVKAAARLANADGFIRRLPQGYDTMIVEDGQNLSQGQRQLLAIARAAIADPPVLILDEATSSIDTRTERQIEKGMNALMNGRTTFVIAHRLSTVRNADCIVVLENGRIIEKGNHDDLLAQKGIYYQLYNGMFELS